MAKAVGGDPVIGIPYHHLYHAVQDPTHHHQHHHQQAGMIPPGAMYGDPRGGPILQTMFRDTPAPFCCVFCGSTGLTDVRSKPSAAAVVGCLMPFMLGFCFLSPSMDCLWHKCHYCPDCGNKVADFEKSDPCLVVDAPRWKEPSFAVPA